MAAISLQLRRTKLIKINHTASRSAITRAAMALHNHRKIVPVHKAHIIEVLDGGGAGEGELSKGGRWGRAGATAFHLARVAIACGAGELAGVVEGAAGAGPEAAGPADGGLEGAGGASS